MQIIAFTQDTEGQASIDFLLGFLLFVSGIFFVFQMIPTLYSVPQYGEVSIHPVAYRASVMLVEDPGMATNGSYNATNWEDYTGNTSMVRRIGLAVSKDKPDLLDADKILALRQLVNTTNTTAVSSKLGMSSSVRTYKFNISLQQFNSTSSITNYSVDKNEFPILKVGDVVYTDYSTIERIERIVSIDDPNWNLSKRGTIDAGTNASGTDFLLDTVSPISFFYINITGAYSTPPPLSFLKVKIDPSCTGGFDYSVSGDDTYALHDLTSYINSYPSGTYLCIDINVKNVVGYYVLSKAGDMMGNNRVGAKLVLQMWEGWTS